MSNSNVLDKIDINRKIWRTRVKRRIRMIGHNLRHLGIVSLMLEGMMEGDN